MFPCMRTAAIRSSRATRGQGAETGQGPGQSRAGWAAASSRAKAHSPMSVRGAWSGRFRDERSSFPLDISSGLSRGVQAARTGGIASRIVTNVAEEKTSRRIRMKLQSRLDGPGQGRPVSIRMHTTASSQIPDEAVNYRQVVSISTTGCAIVHSGIRAHISIQVQPFLSAHRQEESAAGAGP